MVLKLLMYRRRRLVLLLVLRSTSVVRVLGGWRA
jgi:hypothetical protein